MPTVFLLIKEWWAKIDLEFYPGAGVSCMGEEIVNRMIDMMRLIIMCAELLNSASLCFTGILTCDRPTYSSNSGRKVYGFSLLVMLAILAMFPLHLEGGTNRPRIRSLETVNQVD